MTKLVANVGLAVWELSLIPTRIGLEIEANKILHEKKKAEKAAQKKHIDKDVEKMVKESVEDEIVKEAEETVKEETRETVKETKSKKFTFGPKVKAAMCKNKDRRAAKKVRKSEVKKAFDKAKQEADPVPEHVAEEVVKMSQNDVLLRTQYLDKVYRTQELVNYAFYYMSTPDAKLVPMEHQVQREIINAVAAVYEFGKIYDSAGIANLRKYDPTCKDEYLSTNKYLLTLADIESKKNDPAFLESMMKRKEQLLAESECPQDDPAEEESLEATYVEPEDIVNEEELDEVIKKPLFTVGKDFPLEKEVSVQGEGISDELFNKMESVFVPLLNGTKHRYVLDSTGMILLMVTRETGVEERYVVDPGIVMGKGKISVLCKLNNDTLFVSEDHPEILQRALNTAFYILLPQEAQKVIADYFRNMSLYKYIDMTNTEKLNELSEEDFQKLGKKLTFILNKVAEQGQGMDLPRFRFNYWNGVDDFMIISDPAVKSPLAFMNETSPITCDGLIYEVKGDTVIQTFKDSRIEYRINKYGDM